MNRVSRRSAAEAADALLEAGRKEPVLNYDVELGLARHQHWLQSDAPMPEWASAGLGVASQSWMTVAIKTIVSAVVVGALGTGAWYGRGLLQPSAADVRPVSAAPLAAPTVEDVSVTDAPKPIPVSEQALPSEHQVHRAVRSDASDKRATRMQRSHRDRSARAQAQVARVEQAEESPARVEPAVAVAATQASDDSSMEHATHQEVERKPSSTAQKTRPEPGQRAQEPQDLVEMQQVATAEQLLERAPERALALARQGDQRFAHGYFQQERAYIAIMALIRLGRIDEARTRAASFAKQFPPLPYGARIRSALEAAANP